MVKNKKLYEYFFQYVEMISLIWYEIIEEIDLNFIYVLIDFVVIYNLKSQNFVFNYKINCIFIDDEEVYLFILKEWVFEVIQD